MRRIRSFAAALALFIVFVLLTHWIAASFSLKREPKAFGLWYNQYKDRSYNALSENIANDTVLLMGSSEFRHGMNTLYHPRNVFAGKDVTLMEIGGPFNQSLYHTIALGALAPKLKSRKVILLVSPSWFSHTGVSSKSYALRYSETEYIAFMKNKKIPRSVRKYAAERTEKLLLSDRTKYHRARIINRVLLNHSASPVDRLLYQINSLYAEDRDQMTMALALHHSFKKDTASVQETLPGRTISPKSWIQLEESARDNELRKINNPFNMTPQIWKKTFSKRYATAKGVHSRDFFDRSTEYADLEAFLKVCQSNGIQADLIILPVNGKWFDYTGRSYPLRVVMNRRIKALANKYGAQCTSLSKYDYMKGITRDAVHPWGSGWVKINEEIYRFCKEG